MNNILSFGMPGGTEWIVILLAILLLFGAKRLPELAKGLGKSIREFKKATSEVEDNIREAIKEEESRRSRLSPNLSRRRLPLKRTKWNKNFSHIKNKPAVAWRVFLLSKKQTIFIGRFFI